MGFPHPDGGSGGRKPYVPLRLMQQVLLFPLDFSHTNSDLVWTAHNTKRVFGSLGDRSKDLLKPKLGG